MSNQPSSGRLSDEFSKLGRPVLGAQQTAPSNETIMSENTSFGYSPGPTNNDIPMSEDSSSSRSQKLQRQGLHSMDRDIADCVASDANPSTGLTKRLLENPADFQPPTAIKKAITKTAHNHSILAADLAMGSLTIKDDPAARVAMAASVARLERSGEFDFNFLNHHGNKNSAQIAALEYKCNLLERYIRKILKRGIKATDLAKFDESMVNVKKLDHDEDTDDYDSE